MGQISLSFPNSDQVILSNTSQIIFGVNDNETAKYVSERLGETTIVVESGGTSKTRGRNTPDYVTSQNSGSSQKLPLTMDFTVARTPWASTIQPGARPMFSRKSRSR